MSIPSFLGGRLTPSFFQRSSSAGRSNCPGPISFRHSSYPFNGRGLIPGQPCHVTGNPSFLRLDFHVFSSGDPGQREDGSWSRWRSNFSTSDSWGNFISIVCISEHEMFVLVFVLVLLQNLQWRRNQSFLRFDPDRLFHTAATQSSVLVYFKYSLIVKNIFPVWCHDLFKDDKSWTSYWVIWSWKRL